MKAKQLIISFFLIFSAWSGQTIFAQFNYGIKLGGNVSSMNLTDERSHFGGKVGVVAEYYLQSSFGFRTGVFYSIKGSNNGIGLGFLNEKHPLSIDYRIHSIDVPLEILYKVGLDENSHFVFGVGGYYALGADGDRYIYYREEYTKHSPFRTYDENKEYVAIKGLKEHDFGMQLSVDFVYKHIVFGIGYQHGFINLSENRIQPENANVKNRTFNFSVGYNFKAF